MENVYQQLIKQDIDQSQYVSTTSEKDVFFSEGHSTACKIETHYEKERYFIRFNFRNYFKDEV